MQKLAAAFADHTICLVVLTWEDTDRGECWAWGMCCDSTGRCVIIQRSGRHGVTGTWAAFAHSWKSEALLS
jgi:hypothetical protein